MQARSQIILKVLLNRFHRTFKDSLLNGLPEKDRQALLSQEITSTEALLAFKEPFDQIHRMHYSWLKNAIGQLPESLHPAVLSALTEHQAAKLSKWFPYSQRYHIAKPVQAYLLQMLEVHFDHPNAIPIEFLPPSPLNLLTQWTKESLIELIEFLGIYDLAAEIRHIIDKERLKKLSPCLSPKHKKFLHNCLHHPEKISVPLFGLNTWDGNCRSLFILIQNRGAVRLGKALSGQYPDLTWHIAHRLDIGRGSFLLKQYSYQPIKGVTATLMQQVLHLISFLSKKESP